MLFYQLCQIFFKPHLNLNITGRVMRINKYIPVLGLSLSIYFCIKKIGLGFPTGIITATLALPIFYNELFNNL